RGKMGGWQKGTNAVLDKTAGIWSHARLKRSKESRQQRSSKRNIYIVSTPETPINRCNGSLIVSSGTQ
ncbi:hypothetical protein J6590_089912, partial [Homalodisca vitripennis]